MGYLFLCLALFAGITKGYCGKRLGNIAEKSFDAILLNLIRMVLCIIIGLFLVILQGNLSFIIPELNSLLIMVASGITTSLFVVSWLLSVKVGAYMMVEVFVMLGVLVPIVSSSFLYEEAINTNEWIGIVLLIIAAYLMCSYNNSQHSQTNTKSFILLLLCGFSSGLTDLMQKMFVKTAPDVPVSVFNLYTYLFSALFLVPLLFVFYKKDCGSNTQNIKKSILGSIGFIIIMAICLFSYSYFKTAAANHLDSTQLYPLNQGASLVLSTAMATLIFKERFTLKCLFGILIAFIGIIFINVLHF